MKNRIFAALLAMFVFAAALGCGSETSGEEALPESQESAAKISRADEILNSMTLKEKVGQMVMIGVYGTEIDDDSRFMLHQYHVGGVVLFDRNLESAPQVKAFVADLQKYADKKIPLFICIDEEGGDVARMRQIVEPPPSQLEIGDTGDASQAEYWARYTAKSLKDFGINVNFAPVADVGSPDSRSRSYGLSPEVVTKFVRAAAAGYENENFIYSLKHFPGLGRGKVDTHLGAAVIDASRETLESDDVLPFKTLIDEKGATDFFVMVSHANYPALDEENPASLSYEIQTNLLRNGLGFGGVIITDDMNMKAVSDRYTTAEAGVMAVKAGADIVMLCHEYGRAADLYLGILEAAEKGEISEERIDESVRRIIAVKLAHGF